MTFRLIPLKLTCAARSAATAAIESAHLIKYPGFSLGDMNLSEQQLVSCVSSANGYGSAGCGGGYVSEAIDYVARFYQSYDFKYPYTSSGGVTGEMGGALVPHVRKCHVQMSHADVSDA